MPEHAALAGMSRDDLNTLADLLRKLALALEKSSGEASRRESQPTKSRRPESVRVYKSQTLGGLAEPQTMAKRSRETATKTCRFWSRGTAEGIRPARRDESRERFACIAAGVVT